MSRPDQIEVESRIEADSNDEDSTMEDAEISADTPQTRSLAPFDSQEASEESTQASTPTENRAEDVAADTHSRKPSEQEDVADDVTMKDVDPRKNSDPKVVSWPSSTVIDPGSSPWKTEKTEQGPLDYVSDRQKIDELLRFNGSNSPDLYEP